MNPSTSSFNFKNEEHLRRLVSEAGLGKVDQLELAGVQGDIWLWRVTVADGKEYALKLYPAEEDKLAREMAIWNALQESPLLYPKVVLGGLKERIAYLFLEWLGEQFTTLLLQHPDSVIVHLFQQLRLGKAAFIHMATQEGFLNLRVDTAEGKAYLLKIFPIGRTDDLEQNMPSLKQALPSLAGQVIKMGSYLGFFYCVFNWIGEESARHALIENLDRWSNRVTTLQMASPPIQKTETAAVILLADRPSSVAPSKALIEVDGVPLITHMVKAYKACCRHLLVLASTGSNPAIPFAKEAGAEIVVPGDEIKNSITPIEYALELIAGRYFPPCTGVLLANINTPMTDPMTITLLLNAPKTVNTLLAFPNYHGVTGDPIWISPAILKFFIPPANNSEAGKNVRNIIRMVGSRGLGALQMIPGMTQCVSFIQVHNPDVIVTLDTPQHVERWLAYRSKHKQQG